jgi:hypothetical protein
METETPCPYTLVSAYLDSKVKWFLSGDSPREGKFVHNVEKYGLERNIDGSLDCRLKAFRQLMKKNESAQPNTNLFKGFCF